MAGVRLSVMPLKDRGAVWVAICGGLAFFAACKGKTEGHPPPKPYQTSATGVGGGGAAGSDTGGAPVWSGNACECAFEYTFDKACGTCINKARTGDDACKTAAQDCMDEPSGTCSALMTCVATNCYDFDDEPPSPEQVACAQSCFVSLSDETARQLFEKLMSCLCNACAKRCAPSRPIDCSGGGAGGTSSGMSSSSSGP
jgi:hypothetical protein